MSDDVFGAMALDGDRASVRLERLYPTDRKDLWSAITEPDRLIRWFARVEGDFRVDGTFCIFFDDDGEGDRTIGQVRACEPPERLQVTWFFRDEGETVVTATLADAAPGTRLVLEHVRLADAAASGYGAGWQAYLEALAADLSGGSGRGSAWDARWRELVPLYKAQLAELRRP